MKFLIVMFMTICIISSGCGSDNGNNENVHSAITKSDNSIKSTNKVAEHDNTNENIEKNSSVTTKNDNSTNQSNNDDSINFDYNNPEQYYLYEVYPKIAVTMKANAGRAIVGTMFDGNNVPQVEKLPIADADYIMAYYIKNDKYKESWKKIHDDRLRNFDDLIKKYDDAINIVKSPSQPLPSFAESDKFYVSYLELVLQKLKLQKDYRIKADNMWLSMCSELENAGGNRNKENKIVNKYRNENNTLFESMNGKILQVNAEYQRLANEHNKEFDVLLEEHSNGLEALVDKMSQEDRKNYFKYLRDNGVRECFLFKLYRN